jgi:MFS family permease
LKLILAGVMLGSLSISLQTTQLKVVILHAGLDSARASSLLSIYALGVIAGRFLSGAALDVLPSYAVAATVMALPGTALLILATGTASGGLLLLAMVLLGVSLGAEGDVAAYLVMRYFPIEVYSTVLGVVIGSIAFASGIGGLILSASLKLSDDFSPFLAMSGIAALVGGALLWRLRGADEARSPSPREVAREASWKG